ncbi:MAG: hypothetical protein Q7S19_00065 [bacterium]|nr:hypothetical protein [bacterium]
MDKMREKPVEQRRKMLLHSTVSLGLIIGIFGVWNFSNNMTPLALNSDTSGLTEVIDKKSDAPSLFTRLSTNMTAVWRSVQSELMDMNDKLGAK